MSVSPPAYPSGANRLVLRGVGAVFAVSLTVAGVGGTLAWQYNRGIVPDVLGLTIASALGLILGLAARHLLRGSKLGLRVTTAWAAVIVGLILLGLVTRGETGLAFHDPRRSLPDWYGLLQVTLGCLSAVLTMAAWPMRSPEDRSRLPQSAESLTGGSRPAGPRRNTGAASDPSITRPLRARQRPVYSETRPQPARPARGSSRRSNSGLPKQRSRLPVLPRLSAWAKRAAPWRRRRVQLVGAEAHRCPYCLEPVERNDPRGVVVCPVCHTRHHADCWAVTGMCQVPHYHH